MALIAAAPDMLEAIEAVLFAVDWSGGGKGKHTCTCHAMKPGYTCPFCMARAAIAKAKGES